MLVDNAAMEILSSRDVFGRGLPRWCDATIAAAGVVISAPLIAFTALAVLIFSGSPILFRQRRVGLNGETFELYKFRTMRTVRGGLEVTSSNDARVTTLGKFLRRMKLDELPTLWNVVRGDMALVGPRPEVPKFVRLEDPLWRKVLSVRPGITDPVTVQLRNEGDLLNQVCDDVELYYLNELQPLKLKGYVDYLERRNWQSDLVVLTKTLTAIASHREQVPIDRIGRA